MGVLKRAIRGIRDSLPSGYIVGRVSSQDGPAELIDLKTLGQSITAATGGVTAPSGGVADFGLFFPGKPTASQLVFDMIMTKAINLPPVLGGSQFFVTTAPTSNYTFTLKKNTTTIGTITFAASTGAFTVTFIAQVQFILGDRFSITGQSVADGTMSDIAFSFAATFA